MKKLISEPDIIVPKEITINLDTEIIGKDIFYFKSISSTNTYAKKIAEKIKSEGTVIITDIQTQGRGRKNRTWLSPFGGLWFSIVLRPKIQPEYGMYVTMVASISIAQAIKEITNLDPIIKWPNDLLIFGKKVCGILTEFEYKKDKIVYAVIGIGINVNNKIDMQIKKTATSLLKEYGRNVSRVKFLRCILKNFDENYKKLILEDYDFIKNLWSYYAKVFGKSVRIEDDGKTLSGKISGIDDHGYLILKTKDGTYKISSGDITYL